MARRVLLLLWCLSLLAAPAALAAPDLRASPERATDGVYRLSWEADGAARFELQESDGAHFNPARTLYTGADTASVITGRPDGEYFYRVRVLGESGPGPWSEPLQVTVQHHSLARALQFFVVGALVFAVLLAVIIRGVREDRDTP
ncbi:hypothetical protein [Thioalkalivibrio sulfidiphilus]|uniref:Fibronectin type-III domain-containing protein n=1 Tax=Thioalkalivibrio sulfidiphilus (strain HL-EbGR7) TaxID=396588 RepID=B8GTZ5_THISH|nr:hypothetical protein [Thioalkalivibrio sulfidiphilus]ACL71278.1 hypothetical protein Tgr7_0179 [Thioalkalivibrio sulfidiphilus HL-EbGr7]